MVYPCALLLLFCLPISTAEISDLLHTLESYKGQMDQGKVVKQYVEYYSQLLSFLTVNDQYLHESEKVVVQKVRSGVNAARKCFDKTIKNVAVVKEQGNVLNLALNSSANKTKEEKVGVAMYYFSIFAKDMDENMDKSEELTQQTIDELRNVQLEMKFAVETLERVQTDSGVWFAVKVVTLGTLGVLGAVGSPLLPAAIVVVVDTMYIANVHGDFQQMQGEYSEHIKGLKAISNATEVLREGLDATLKQFRSISAKLEIAGTITEKEIISPNPDVEYDVLLSFVWELISSCETYLN